MPTDAVWEDDDDGTGTVTFQMLECSVCGGRKLDCLQDNADIQVTLSQQYTLDCTVEVIESTGEGTTKVYTLKEQTITDGAKTYTVSAANVQQVTPGAGHQATGYQHDADKHWQVCTVCGKIFNQAAHTALDAIGAQAHGQSAGQEQRDELLHVAFLLFMFLR